MGMAYNEKSIAATVYQQIILYTVHLLSNSECLLTPLLLQAF